MPRARKAAGIDLKVMGAEPILGTVEGPNDSKLSSALGWYNYMYEAKEATHFVTDYMKAQKSFSKSDIQRIKQAKPWDYGGITTMALARLFTNGMKNKVLEQRLQDRLRFGIETVPAPEEKKDEGPVVSVRDRVDATATPHIERIDLLVDTLLKHKGKVHLTQKDFSPYQYFTEQDVSGPAVRIIGAQFQEILDELDLRAKDEQVAEAYAHHSNKSIKELVLFLRSVIEDCERYASNKRKRVTRKPRRAKEKPASKLVEKLKFQKEDTASKLSSIRPTDIIKSTTLWVYNTKYRVLGCYVTNSTNGLSVKRSSIANFDPELSVAKKLRKPEQVLEQVLSGGKVQLRKLLGNIKAKEKPLSGRISEHTILLRVTK